MQEAKRLIVQNNRTIFEVAMNVGYNDVSSFSKLFKNQFGVSPAALRKDF
jgi:AraC-like DNA-binding protein